MISVVYFALVEAARLERAVESRADHTLRMASLACADGVGAGGQGAIACDESGAALDLAFDHAVVLGMATERLRGKLDYAPIGFELLPETFTLRDLRLVHEAILGRPLNKDSFRRKVLDRGLVEPTGALLRGTAIGPPSSTASPASAAPADARLL